MPAKTRDIAAELLADYGELISGEELRNLLGYRSKRSFYRAIGDRRTPVELFKLHGGRLWNARTQDVAEWLSQVGGVKRQSID